MGASMPAAGYEDVKKTALCVFPQTVVEDTLETAQEIVTSKLLDGLELANETASEEAKDQRSAIEYALHVVVEQSLDVALEKNVPFVKSGVSRLLDVAIWMASKNITE